MIEEWRDIDGYEGLYQVSSLGRVRSLKFGKERILKIDKNNKGYLQVGFKKDGRKKKWYRIHRLVANAFIPNPNNLPEVNHKDEDKNNNRVDNLEWCDGKYNIRYSKAVAVNQYTLDGRFTRTWDCMKDIHIQLGYSAGNICRCCQGKKQSANGYQWFYADDLRQPEPPLW